jgi:hypothetical protein
MAPCNHNPLLVHRQGDFPAPASAPFSRESPFPPFGDVRLNQVDRLRFERLGVEQVVSASDQVIYASGQAVYASGRGASPWERVVSASGRVADRQEPVIYASERVVNCQEFDMNTSERAVNCQEYVIHASEPTASVSEPKGNGQERQKSAGHHDERRCSYGKRVVSRHGGPV